MGNNGAARDNQLTLRHGAIASGMTGLLAMGDRAGMYTPTSRAIENTAQAAERNPQHMPATPARTCSSSSGDTCGTKRMAMWMAAVRGASSTWGCTCAATRSASVS